MEEENLGIRLLKKGKHGIYKGIFSRIVIILLFFLMQIFILIGMYGKFSEYIPHYTGISALFVIIMLLFLINSEMNSSAKMTWMAIIMVFPIFGAAFLLYTKADLGHRTLKYRLNKIISDTKQAIPQKKETIDRLAKEDTSMVAIGKYLSRSGCFPIYENSDVVYFKSGEEKFEELLIQLRKAKKYIFLEYFIIDEGEMWGKILEILVEKVKEGVDVRVMYDGTCEVSLLPHNYPKKLRKLGIKCKIFAPLTPFFSTLYNYRDHRKILVIDGHTAFTGGVNLADEYINKIDRFGHWKDSAVMIKGNAVKSFILMFLQMWNMDERKPEFDKYLDYDIRKKYSSKGFVIPYGDVPLDDDKVGEIVYMDILNRAANYVHIMTPYLILDGEMETALKFAAERGVDVKIILPGIPDKKYAFALAKTHYANLLVSGVKIFEYTPGFVHSKVFVSDDIKAVVGTINLDYRSLYHHFECATYMYKMDCISEIEDDFNETLKLCKEITKEDIRKEKARVKMVGRLLKIISPLL